MIKTFAATRPAPRVAGPALGAPATDAKMLVVFLRGAYDAANVVVRSPAGSTRHRGRTLAIAKPEVANPNAASRSTANWGCIRLARQHISARGQARRIAFIPFAGHQTKTDPEPFETQGHRSSSASPPAARATIAPRFLSRLAPR